MKSRQLVPRLKGIRLACVTFAAAVGSQPSIVCAQEPSPPDTAVVQWAALTNKPRILDSAAAAAIHYPALLREAKVSGEVQAVLVIDTAGRPVDRLTRVISRSHDLFSNQVRHATRAWRFSPAMQDGRPVGVELPVAVSFRVPEDRDVPLREISVLSADSSGVHVVTGWEELPREVSTPTDSADIKWAKLVVLLRLLSLNPNADTLAKTCVRWSDAPRHALPPAMMSRIRAQYADVVNADACPRTYWSMTVLVDSSGAPVRRAPRGHVDPVWVTIGSVEPWTRDLYVITAYVSPAGSETRYYCEASRDERGRWFASCEMRATTLH